MQHGNLDEGHIPIQSCRLSTLANRKCETRFTCCAVNAWLNIVQISACNYSVL